MPRPYDRFGTTEFAQFRFIRGFARRATALLAGETPALP
jgi:hypothetical protein